MTILEIIRNKKVPNVILRYIMMNFLDLDSIKNIVLNVKYMSVLDSYSKLFLERATKGLHWNCMRGHLDVAKWILTANKNIYTPYRYEQCFNIACFCGHIDVAKWLYLFDNIGDWMIEPSLNSACQNGYLNTAIWLHSILKNKTVQLYVELFIISCKRGHIGIVHWLCNFCNDIYTKSYNKIYDKYIYLCDDQYDPNHNIIKETFILACENSYLDVAQFLFNKYLVNNDCKILMQYTFRKACHLNRIDVAQWLHSTKMVDIHADQDYCYNISPDNIRSWLKSIDQ